MAIRVAARSGLLPVLLTLCSIALGQAAEPSPGERIYLTLRDQGLLEDYLTPSVSELVGTLIQTSGRWPNFQVNRPYRPGAVNVYLVDARRIPEPNPLRDLGLHLERDRLAGNALAHEPTGVLLVDSGFLKSLVTAAIVTSETGQDIVATVGAIQAFGIDAFRDIWDPERNPGLLSAGYADPWVVKASGAAAFALAHEMGHLAQGARNPARQRMPMLFRNPADRDAHWACADLVQEKYRRQQEIEQAADDFAADLLAQVLFPEGVLSEPKLRYEIGARWYLLYGMAEQMVRALDATESPRIRRMLEIQFGPQVFAALSARKQETGKGSISAFFPESHPANVRRAARSLDRLTQSPYSVDAGSPPAPDPQIAMLETVLAMECRDIAARQGTAR